MDGKQSSQTRPPAKQGVPPGLTPPLPKPPSPHLRGDELQPPALAILLLLHQAPHLGVALGQALLPRPAREVPGGGGGGSGAVLCPLAAGAHPAPPSLQALHREGGTGCDPLQPIPGPAGATPPCSVTGVTPQGGSLGTPRTPQSTWRPPGPQGARGDSSMVPQKHMGTPQAPQRAHGDPSEVPTWHKGTPKTHGHPPKLSPG